MLAVGSNASPAVLGDKLRVLLRPGQEPVYIDVCRVAGLAVGHSAHLSKPGFVPAAPFRSSHSAAYSVAWLTPAQANALDATEPNYDRMPLPADLAAHTNRISAAIDGVTLYVSHHGVLAQGEHPVPLMSQPHVLAWLRERLDSLRGIADDAIFTDPDVREAVRGELAGGGWVAPSGL